MWFCIWEKNPDFCRVGTIFIANRIKNIYNGGKYWDFLLYGAKLKKKSGKMFMGGGLKIDKKFYREVNSFLYGVRICANKFILGINCYFEYSGWKNVF